MKVKILLFTFLTASYFCTAQESKTVITKAKLAEIERSIQANTSDTALLAVIEKEKTLSKQLNKRVEEITKSDKTYNKLKAELAAIKATKTDKLIAYSKEYKAGYEDLKNNTERQQDLTNKQDGIAKKQELKEQELADKKAGIAKKQEMMEQELADKKAGIAKKQEMMEQEAADKKAGIAKKQEIKEQESADKKATAASKQAKKAEELIQLQKQKRAELEQKHKAAKALKNKKGK